MKSNLVYLLGILLLCSCSLKSSSYEVKVMSFNIWMGGGKSIERTADVIVQSGADIVGIQEARKKESNTAVFIAEKLGWHSHVTNGSCTIISKYPIVEQSASGKGVKIQTGENRFVWMFNVHLIYCPYEPYQLSGIEYCGGPLLSTASEAVESAWNSRGEEVMLVVDEIKKAQKENCPIFLTGDFNEPSWLDWTDNAAKAGLCKMKVEWPATKNFQQQAEMKDSYRTLFPDEVKNPGHSWTTLPEKEKYTEVLDRIDFVFFWGPATPVRSQLVGEAGKFSNIAVEEYPSDHRAVLSTFSINP